MLDLLEGLCTVLDVLGFIIDLILYPFVKFINIFRKEKNAFDTFYFTKKAKKSDLKQRLKNKYKKN